MSKPVQIKQRTRFTDRGRVLTQEIKALGLKVVETFDERSDLYATRVTIKAKVAPGLVFHATANGRRVCLHSYMSAVYADLECALLFSSLEKSEDRVVLAAYIDRFCTIRAQVEARNYVVK